MYLVIWNNRTSNFSVIVKGAAVCLTKEGLRRLSDKLWSEGYDTDVFNWDPILAQTTEITREDFKKLVGE